MNKKITFESFLKQLDDKDWSGWKKRMNRKDKKGRRDLGLRKGDGGLAEAAEMSKKDVRSVLNTVFAVIASLKNKVKADNNLRKMYSKDLENYETVANYIKSDNQKDARAAWRRMDTAARDYVFDMAKTKTLRKALATYFNVELIHEGKMAAKDVELVKNAMKKLPLKSKGVGVYTAPLRTEAEQGWGIVHISKWADGKAVTKELTNLGFQVRLNRYSNSVYFRRTPLDEAESVKSMWKHANVVKHVEDEEEDMDDTQECPSCDGRGTEYDETCMRCGGKGRLTKDGDYIEQEDEEEDLDDDSFEDEDNDDYDEFDQEDEDDLGADELDDEVENEDEDEEDPDRQGVIRTVKGAHLVYKRQAEDGTFEELWIYNVEVGMKDELDVRRDILAGTDIELPKTTSEDGEQSFELWTAGNAQLLKISGLPQ